MRPPSKEGRSKRVFSDRLARLRRKKSADLERLRVSLSEMEERLLTLKERRELLKEKGARHEDEVMKENAIMQVGRKISILLALD